jgi:putative ABC transport system permease protein
MRRLTFFVRIFTWFSVRNLRRHLGRALIVVLGIALGAAVFTSVRISVHASLASFSRSMAFSPAPPKRFWCSRGATSPRR